MDLYRIAYIDESKEEIEKFQRFCYPTFDVIPIYPAPDIRDSISDIIDAHVDAVISDFEFSEQASNIKYEGTDLINLFLSKREGFPVFIFTSYEDEAIRKSDDVNIIYEKGEKYLDDGKGNISKNIKLLERIKLQIEKYKRKLENEENRLIELIGESKKRKLDAIEKEELKSLDSKIEKTLDKESRISDILRDDNEASELSQLLKKVDELNKSLGKKDE